MKVTIAQINSTNGDLEGNVAKILGQSKKPKLTIRILLFFPNSLRTATLRRIGFKTAILSLTLSIRLTRSFPQPKELRRLSARFDRMKTPTDDGFLIQRQLFQMEN